MNKTSSTVGAVLSCLYYSLLAYYFLYLALFAISLTPSRMWLRGPLDGLYGPISSGHDSADPKRAVSPGAALVNVLLIGLFVVQHSAMSRLGFQSVARWAAGQAGERLLHLVASCVVSHIMIRYWQHIPQLAWSLPEDSVLAVLLQLLSLLSSGFLVLSLLTVAYHDLFQYRQALTGQQLPGVPEVLPLVYRCTRQPVFSAMLGTFWFTPAMTYGQLLFACSMTLYTLLGVALHERDQVKQKGEPYRAYTKQVPAIVPGLFTPWLRFLPGGSRK